MSTRPFSFRHCMSGICAGLVVLASGPAALASEDLTRLQGLLSATPAGGWVEVSTGSFSSVWPTGSTSVGTVYPTVYGPGAVAYAWSSFAWDSNRGQLMLWGGGHANYGGNEMYAWEADTGQWARLSLPSALIDTPLGNGAKYVVDNAAPVSAHTYNGNVFLPVNDMFINFLGPSYNSGDRGKTWINGVEYDNGPWMFDPTKADANKVGGTTGSGFDSTSLGGNMWLNRYGQWTGNVVPPYAPYVSASYRQEGGKDVVYLVMDSQSSLTPSLMRYTAGDVRNGGLDTWEQIGVTVNGLVAWGTGTLDTTHNLMVRVGYTPGGSDLVVWNLANANASNPALNPDISITLVGPDGSPFVMNPNMSIEYDQADDQLVIWDGSAKGMVWVTRATYLSNGQLAPDWVVQQLFSSTTAQPEGNFVAGVYGKWKYIPELGAFMALDEFNRTTLDAPVWLYKPLALAVPESSTSTMLLAGLAVLGFAALRRPASTSLH